MEHLTADDIRSQELPADITTASPDAELDRALARAIRRLIAGARDRDRELTVQNVQKPLA